MRNFSTLVRRGLVLSALLLIVVPAAFTDDAPNPADPPAATIHPPIGVTSQATIHPPIGVTSSQATIHPPGGVTSQATIHPPIGGQAQINPPGGVTPSPSFYERFLDWLVLQARIHPPIG